MGIKSRITNIRTRLCDTGHKRLFLFVLVETDTGIIGLGEGSQSNQDAAVVASIRQIAPSYIGKDPLNLIGDARLPMRDPRLGRSMFIAISAIEQALWDIVGKLLDVPVFQLLGGQCRDSIKCYATMSAGINNRTPEGQAEEALRCVNLGFTAIKLVAFEPIDRRNSYNFSQILKRGIERVASVRSAIGPDIDLMIECNFSFDYKMTRWVGEALEPFDCYWIEAPLAWDDAEQLYQLRQLLPQRLASGEMMLGMKSYLGLLERKAVDVLQPDVKWTGGIMEVRHIAAWAETCQIGVAPHNNSGPVATAASAHLSATLPNFLVLEVPSRSPDWEDELLLGSAYWKNGTISIEHLSNKPGWGIDFEENVAGTYEVKM